MSNSIAYLNGDFVALDQAKISVLDRGFIFGDAIYEVIPVFCGNLFRLNEHLSRLNDSLNNVKIKNPYTTEKWQTLLEELVIKNNSASLSIYLQITRGVAPRNHAFPDNIKPTVFLMATAMAELSQAVLERGVSVVTMDDIRWQYCHIKTTALIANVLLRQQAVEQNAIEALLIKDGIVTEGSASSVFIIKDQIIYTAPKTNAVLPGITRELVIELAKKLDLNIKEQEIPESLLRSADEVCLTSSTKDIIAVTKLDNINVSNGMPGPIWKQLHIAFNEFKNKLCA